MVFAHLGFEGRDKGSCFHQCRNESDPTLGVEKTGLCTGAASVPVGEN